MDLRPLPVRTNPAMDVVFVNLESGPLVTLGGYDWPLDGLLRANEERRHSRLNTVAMRCWG